MTQWIILRRKGNCVQFWKNPIITMVIFGFFHRRIKIIGSTGYARLDQRDIDYKDRLVTTLKGSYLSRL